MDNATTVTDLLILKYLKQHCNDTIVKSFTKGKKINIEPEKAAPVSLSEVLNSYENCSRSPSVTNSMKNKPKATNVSPTKLKLITSTPKPITARKHNKSSSSDDSDDEADSDVDDKVEMDGNAGKKKHLTKTRKKPSGKNYFIIRSSLLK